MPNAPLTNQDSPPPVLRFPDRDGPARSGHLPISLTSFVGRAGDVAAVAALLRRSEGRLVTLTGPGGVGKTRLATEVAATVGDAFAGGIWFIPLAPIRHSTLFVPTVAAAFGVAEGGRQPLIDRLVDHLRERDALLVLDNFEQLIAAAPILLGLLIACPRLKALVTSREVLRVSGERDFPVAPLQMPDPDHLPPGDQLLDFPAVWLFVERVRALDPAFTPATADAAAIAAICHRLDGLPLAIELAAARGNLLLPRALLARLERRLPVLTGGPRDAPDRLRTMRDAIRWSHDLLDPEDQHLFRRLAVFAGGFTLEAASTVCEELDELSLLDGVGSLVDKNLLHREAGVPGQGADQARLAMLETVREFGQEQLALSDPQDTARRRHAGWCLAFAEDFWANIIRGPVVAEEIQRVSAEHDNLRAALWWLEQSGGDDGAGFLRLASAIWPFWLFGNHLSEGRGWLERALTRCQTTSPALRARALRGLGLLTRPMGDDALATAYLEESLALARTVDDTAGLARSLHMLAMAVIGDGDYERARDLWAEALLRFQSLPDGCKWVALVYHHLGLVAYGEGDPERAAAMIEDALILYRELGDPRGLASSLIARALVAREQSDDEASAALFRESLPLWEQLGIQEGLAAWLAGVATLAVSRDRLVQAARVFGAAARLAERAGVTFRLPERAAYERALATIRATVGEPSLTAAQEEGRALPVAQVVAEAREFLAWPDVEDAASSAANEDFGLTARERDVLRYLATGRTDREIAETLFVSPRTVQSHVARIRKKLAVHSRTEAVTLAMRYDLI